MKMNMINSIKHRITSDSILSRFCLASLICAPMALNHRARRSQSASAPRTPSFSKPKVNWLLHVSLILMVFGVGEAWGECTLISGGSGSITNIKDAGKTVYSCSFSNSENDAATMSYTCTIGTYTNVGKIRNYGSNVIVEAYYNSDWHEIVTLDYGYDNQNQARTHTLSGDAMKLTQVRFKTTDGTTLKYDYSVSNFKIVRASVLSLSASAYEFSTTPEGGNNSQTFTVTTRNIEISASDITISGTNVGYFSKALSAASGDDCLRTYTLTITYSPAAATIGESKHEATVTISKGGKTATLTLAGTASEITHPVYRWNGEETTTFEIDDTREVGGSSINLSTIWTSTSDGTITYDTVSFTPSGINNAGATKPSVTGTTLSLGQAGTVRLCLAQAPGSGYYAGKDTVDLVIQKRANAITCSWGSWSKDVNFYSVTDVEFSSDNDAFLPTVTPTSGESIATYNSGTNKIIANYRDGEATWSISQAEDYKYQAAATKNCTIRVGSFESPGCNILENQSDQKSIWHGDTDHEHTWDVENAAGVITYEISKNDGLDMGYNVQQYVNGKWENLTDYKTDYTTDWGDWKHETLNRAAKGVRIRAKGGSLTYVRNVSVSRAVYIETNNTSGSAISSLRIPSRLVADEATTASFYVNYSTCDDKVLLRSSNPKIKFANGTTSYQFDTDNTGRKLVTLSYYSDEVEEAEAVITVYTTYENRSLTVTSETVDLLTPTITWPGTKVFEVGDDISNGFTVVDENGDPIEGGTWSFVSSDPTVIDIVNNKLIAQTLSVDSKTATITGTLAEGRTYKSGSCDVVLTVNRKPNTITIGGGYSSTMLMDATMSSIAVSSSNSDTENKPFSITSCPSADTAVFTMTGAGAGSIESKHYLGTVTWRVHQDADGTYKAADKDFSVTISKATEDTSRKIYIYESSTNEEYDRGDFPETWWDIKNVAKKLYVQVKSGAKDSWVRPQEYDEAKSNWVDLSKITGESEINIDSFDANKTAERSLTRTSTGIRFNDSGGKGTKIVRNVKVECYSYLRVNVTSDDTADTLKITKQADGVHPIYMDGEGLDTLRVYYGISYNSGDLKLVCDNPKFTFTDERSAGMTLLENSAFPKAGKQEVKVYYNPTEAVNDTAHVIIYNKAFYKEVTLVGVNIKYSQTVTWNIGAQLKLDAENKISNAANVTLGTAITYMSSDETVVEVTDGGTKLLAKKAGDARIYASASGNGRYYAALDSIDVTVVALKSDVTVAATSEWTSKTIDEVTPVSVIESVNITTEVSVYSLDIAENKIVTVKPTGGLEIGAGGLTIGDGGKLVIETTTTGETKGETGYIRFSPQYDGDMPEAEIQLHKRGYNKSGTSTWQYIGYPMEAGAEAKTVFYRNYLRSWVEETSSWVNNISSLSLESFIGYAVSQARNSAGEMHTFTGTLRENRGEAAVDLSCDGEGWNLVANSFAAPIDITRLTKEDFGGAEATIFIWDTDGREYIEIPVLSAEDMLAGGSLESAVVPAMQGFFVKTSAATKLTLNYNRLVWGADPEHGNTAVRVKRRAPENRLDGHVKIRLIEGENEDEVILMESAERFSKAYENGLDAYKKMGEEGIGIYAIEDGEEIAVDATNAMIGTELGIKTGENDWYTISFENVQGEKKLCLIDYSTGVETLIENGATYSFYAEPNTTTDGRFEIVVSTESTNTTTGVDNEEVSKKAIKYIKDETVYILKNGIKYNSLGQRVQ